MVNFTSTQKAEFDKLHAQSDKLSLYDAMKEVRNKETVYPVLHLYLFSEETACVNQKAFSTVWIEPSLITVEVEKYYLLIFAGMYISLDPDNKVCFTAKDDYTVAYQKQFTQTEIDDLQDRPEFSNRVALDQCKVEVSVDDKDNPTKPDMSDKEETDEDFSEDKSEPVPPDEPEETDEAEEESTE